MPVQVLLHLMLNWTSWSNASNMTWKSSLKVESADPSWPNRDPRHPHSWFVRLIEEAFTSLFSKITLCRFFKLVS